MATAAGHTGRVDAMANLAGVFRPPAPIVETSLEDWNQTIAVNLAVRRTAPGRGFRPLAPYGQAGLLGWLHPSERVAGEGNVPGK